MNLQGHRACIWPTCATLGNSGPRSSSLSLTSMCHSWQFSPPQSPLMPIHLIEWAQVPCFTGNLDIPEVDCSFLRPSSQPALHISVHFVFTSPWLLPILIPASHGMCPWWSLLVASSRQLVNPFHLHNSHAVAPRPRSEKLLP